MAKINKQRMTAEIEGDFVVFLIGMRVNRWWKVHKWLPVARAMPRMMQELYDNPELGFLGHNSGGPGLTVQYWRSFEHLEAYARSKDHEHLPAWADFNKRIRANSGDVGIWHETYKVSAGQYEAFYNNVPEFGLGKVGKLTPITKQNSRARERLQGDY